MVAVIKTVEEIREELIGLIGKAGGDRQAHELLKPLCGGVCPDRSTLGRFRRGEGKPALVSMTTVLLRMALEN